MGGLVRGRTTLLFDRIGKDAGVPSLTRWFIKTSLVDFVLALLAGVLMALPPLSRTGAYDWLFPIYLHLLAFGWLSQLIFGVAYWMFPKFTLERPHASVGLGWATYGLLNAGLVVRAVSEPMNTVHPGPVWGWLVVISALLQWLAGIFFVVNSWGRVKVK